MCQLAIRVPPDQLLSVRSKVGLLTMDENGVVAQLSPQHFRGFSAAAGGVGDLDIICAPLHHGQKDIVEAVPVLVLDVRLNLNVFPVNIRVVIFERSEGELDVINNTQTIKTAKYHSWSYLSSRINVNYLVLAEYARTLDFLSPALIQSGDAT